MIKLEDAATGNRDVVEVQLETNDKPYFNEGESAHIPMGYSYLVSSESGAHVVELKTLALTPIAAKFKKMR